MSYVNVARRRPLAEFQLLANYPKSDSTLRVGLFSLSNRVGETRKGAEGASLPATSQAQRTTPARRL